MIIDLSAISPSFSAGYATSRIKFREACEVRDLPVDDFVHPLPGPDGEALAISVSRIGPKDASKLVIVISGNHGLEGLAGSGAQIAWLRFGGGADLPPDTAVLVVHMLNPWGCAWGRRQNEDNIDLNRNFMDFSQDLPENELYDALHPVVMNGGANGRAADDPQVLAYRDKVGEANFANALFRGQYGHPDGVGFGGHKPSWSRTMLEVILRGHANSARHAAVIDFHTGLGPYGYGVLLSLDRLGSANFAAAQNWFGPGVVALADDPNAAYQLEGDLLRWVGRTLGIDCVSLSLEFGTFDVDQLLFLQIDDCRQRRNGGDSAEIRTGLRNFFYPATPDWLEAVALRGIQVIEQAICGIAQTDAG